MKSVAGILAALLVASALPAAQEEPAPVVYTNADLLRLFGPPAPASPAPAVQPSDDAAWSLVDDMLRREEERRERERQRELERQRAAAPEPEPTWTYPVAWRLGFPASLWWRSVWCAYSGSEGTPGTPGLYPPCPSPEPTPRARN